MPEPNRFTTWFGAEQAAWDIRSEGPFRFVDLRYWAHVFRAVDDAMPDVGLHVIATDDLDGPLPATGRDVVVLAVNDEFGRCPRYAFDVRLVVKTMGAGKRRPYVALWPPKRWPTVPVVALQEILVQLRRLPYLLRATAGTARRVRRPPLLDVPLGLRAFHERPVPPFDGRVHDVSFAGSLVNTPGEERRRPLPQKVRFRREFLSAVQTVRAARPDLTFSVRTVPSHWAAINEMDVYTKELLDSRVVLCPRGSSLDTHRFFEALRAGCVPVYEVLPRRPYYRGSPAVRCKDWDRLPGLLDDLFADPVALQQRQAECLRWYEQHVAPPAVSARIVERLT